MTALDICKVVGVLYAIAYLLSSLAAFAEDAPHAVTIADCPPGTVLAVEETSEPQLMAKVEGALSTPPSIEAIRTEALEAPKQFVTGCIPKQPQNQ